MAMKTKCMRRKRDEEKITFEDAELERDFVEWYFHRDDHLSVSVNFSTHIKICNCIGNVGLIVGLFSCSLDSPFECIFCLVSSVMRIFCILRQIEIFVSSFHIIYCCLSHTHTHIQSVCLLDLLNSNQTKKNL